MVADMPADGGGDVEGYDIDELADLPSVEHLFERQEVPGWKEQITLRAMVVSLLLGFFLSFIVMNLNLTTGIIPSLNVSAGLLGFFLVKIWARLMERIGIAQSPFTRQENTVIQTCVVACSGIAFSGGFGSHLLAMSKMVADAMGETTNIQVNVKDPSIGWMTAFLLTVSFIGLFSVVPLRKIMILGYKLPYPSGTATAHLINSFHTPMGAQLAKKQVSLLFKSLGASFLWSFFKWFYTGGENCGFTSFPSFGLEAYDNKFYFDFSAAYVGVGMICPHMINFSLLLGSVISWGILWPHISSKKGVWYSADLPDSSLHGLNGYQVFIAIALILGDGTFHFVKVLYQTWEDMHTKKMEQENAPPISDRQKVDLPVISFDDRRRIKVFLKDQIPSRAVSGGYFGLAITSIVAVPYIFPQLRFYHIAAAYIAAPVVAFCNAYGCGLTDWSLAASYGKLAIFIFGAWVGVGNGGVLAGLAACGLMMSIVSTASDLMQDFRTGYLTLASPRSMFVSQVIGTFMGCIISPIVFLIFYRAFPLGDPNSDYPAPYAKMYRGIALLGVEGLSSLPKNCVGFCIAFFCIGIAINVVREVAKFMGWEWHHYIPSAMGMAVPFYLGSYIAIDMCVGSVVLFLWQRVNKRQADIFAAAVASGLICGDGIWSLPSSMLALAKVEPPICMKFLSREENFRVEEMFERGTISTTTTKLLLV